MEQKYRKTIIERDKEKVANINSLEKLPKKRIRLETENIYKFYRIKKQKTHLPDVSELNSKQSNIIWPKIRSNIENFDLIKNFEDQTSPEHLKRMICTVCSRASFLNNNLVSKYLHNIDYIKKHKEVLLIPISNNTYNMTEFIYNHDFEQLNGLMLNRKGFINENKLINSINHVFKMVIYN